MGASDDCLMFFYFAHSLIVELIPRPCCRAVDANAQRAALGIAFAPGNGQRDGYSNRALKRAADTLLLQSGGRSHLYLWRARSDASTVSPLARMRRREVVARHVATDQDVPAVRNSAHSRVGGARGVLLSSHSVTCESSAPQTLRIVVA